MTRLGEALAELFGAQENVDSLFARQDFIDGSIKEAELNPILTAAEGIIAEVAEDYKEQFLSSYKDVMGQRLGFSIDSEDDFKLVSELLTLMETFELDFHHFFYRLSHEDFSGAGIIGSANGNFGGAGKDEAIKEVDKFLATYRERLAKSGIAIDANRSIHMKRANPNFILRSWILDEVIYKVEKEGNRDVLATVLDFATNPFGSHESEDGKRYCGEIPTTARAGTNAQCSCSS